MKQAFLQVDMTLVTAVYDMISGSTKMLEENRNVIWLIFFNASMDSN